MQTVLIPALKLSLDESGESFLVSAARQLKIRPEDIRSLKIVRRSLDARKKDDVFFSVHCLLTAPESVCRRLLNDTRLHAQPAPAPAVLSPSHGKEEKRGEVIVCGFGPAGIFAAWLLAREGYKPVVIERGRAIEERTRDVENYWQTGRVHPESNPMFGEGGAGTFSDGKLVTRIGDRRTGAVLEAMHALGAPEDILWKAKPHVGTDVLRDVVENAAAEIVRLGGEIRYDTKAEKIADGKIKIGGEWEKCGVIVVAPGHSARDLYESLMSDGFAIEAKPFSVGVRIEHLQRDLDRAMYGDEALAQYLGHAEYTLSHREGERGVYTFCMCPGGEVIAAASEHGGVAVNGMSYHARSGENANSALLVGIRPEDFGDAHPLSSIRLQREIEEKAFIAGGRNLYAPVQRAEDFLSDRPSRRIGDIIPTYQPGVTPCDLRDVLPAFMVENLKTGIRAMAGQIKGFDHPDAILTGAETRSSSPVRLVRGEDFVSRSIRGVYPVGEGAGYAGGIVSAAVDGVNAALAIVR